MLVRHDGLMKRPEPRQYITRLQKWGANITECFPNELTQQIQQLRLVNHRYTQLLRLDQLATGLGAGHHIVGLFTDRASHLGPSRFQPVFGFVTAQRGQRAGDDKGFARQRLRCHRRRFAFLPRHATGAQLLHHFAVVRLIKKSANAFGHDGTDIAHGQQLRFGGLHNGVELAEMPRQFFCGGFARMANAQAENKTRQRGLL